MDSTVSDANTGLPANTALLALEDGSVFYGTSIGADGESVGEVVFNTAMTGYQEILTDPSYCRQIVTLTYPHIGNVGTNAEDAESDAVHVAGLVVRDSGQMSSWRGEQSLETYCREHGVVAIAEIDTRELTRRLRDQGAMKGCIVAGDDLDATAAVEKAQAFAGLAGMDLIPEVGTRAVREWAEGSWWVDGSARPEPSRHVVAYDYGFKQNILRKLVDRGCRITLFPADTPVDELLAAKPDGILVGNGPGDPAACTKAIGDIERVLETGIPLFGICLGHQLLALASGAKTSKMKFGHHGANHPVQDIASKRVLISSQNHGFAVEEDSLPAHLEATHRSLFDGSLQGIRRTDCPAFSFQGHPEASPGPHDLDLLFDQFVESIDARR
ncbi:glutamine-hydrolyzing carbamoyl-phosphate synthase small subunit [Guyparkeria halophila]|uniref:Carbamoyl phosphate synthase small chain n=1 Tax=Guyparkeria halophila TaxID=47960 RepID=A0ABZ0YW67_9GAMM|nr:glutamine-hydrolyzing carbamoyl-phosphate synthase small subunit [Guyparkeria halophila]WQH15446.1 glutamine-hydrolyzing carbamoyl-phosphate synthase small subunit [Guyparkeria halophila]